MAKISNEAKKSYFEKIKEYKNIIEQIKNKEKTLLKEIRDDPDNAGYKRLIMGDENITIVSYYLLMNSLSLSLLGIRNEAFLNDARKGCYKVIIYLEEIVSDLIDAPFSEYSERLETIVNFSDDKRYELIKKLGFAIQSVVEGFGENSKWKWSFVEIEARFATVAKNLINMKTLVAGMDPRADHYESRMAYLELIKKIMQQSADKYRQKYELSTLRIDDFKIAISYLQALRRFHILLGEVEEAEVMRKKVEVWKAKMETDLKKHDQEIKEARMGKRL